MRVLSYNLPDAIQLEYNNSLPCPLWGPCGAAAFSLRLPASIGLHSQPLQCIEVHIHNVNARSLWQLQLAEWREFT